MSLSDEAKQDSRKGGVACSAGKWLSTLSSDERAELDDALGDPTIPRAAIIRALNARGHQVSPTGFKSHFSGQCKCR